MPESGVETGMIKAVGSSYLCWVGSLVIGMPGNCPHTFK